MAYFKLNPPTLEELERWKQNNLINPRTNRPIKINSSIYQIFSNFSFKVMNPNQHLLINEEEDPVSFVKFWEVKDNQKVWANEVPKEEVFIYQENNLIRGLHYQTLLGFYQNQITKHPISGLAIPTEVFDKLKTFCLKNKINMEKEEDTKNINDLALRTFQLFSALNIYIDSQEYCQLDYNKIRALGNELRSFYSENLTFTQKNQVNPDNKVLFILKNYEEMRRQILLDIMYLMKNVNENNKMLISYLILGGLIIVLPNLKQAYPHLEFGFIN